MRIRKVLARPWVGGVRVPRHLLLISFCINSAILSNLHHRPTKAGLKHIYWNLLYHVYEVPLTNITMERHRWTGKTLTLGTSEAQYVVMVTKLLSSYCGARSTFRGIFGARIKHFSYKLAEISHSSYLTNDLVYDACMSVWRRCGLMLRSVEQKAWVRWVWRLHLANLHDLCQKLEYMYLWNEKRYLKIVNIIFLLIQTTYSCFKNTENVSHKKVAIFVVVPL